MKTTFVLVAIISVSIVISACSPKPDAVFLSAARSVVRVVSVSKPGSDSLSRAVKDAGGFPATVDTVGSQKASDSQFALGYDKGGRAVAAVVVDKNGAVSDITDPDLLAAYDRKVRVITGQGAAASDSTAGTATASSGGSSGPAAASHGGGGNLPGCPIHVGDSKAYVDHKLGHPDVDSQNSDGSETCSYAPFDVKANVEANAVGYVSGFFGMGAGLANHEGQKARHKGKSYTVIFQNGVAAEINITQ